MGNKYTGSVPALWEKKLQAAPWLHSAAKEHEIQTPFADFTALPAPLAHMCSCRIQSRRLPDTYCRSMKRWFCGSGSGSSLCGGWQPCGCTLSSSWSQASWPPAQHCGCTPQRTLGREHHCKSDGTDTPSNEPATRSRTHCWAEPGNDDLHKQQSIKLQNIIRMNIFKVTKTSSSQQMYTQILEKNAAICSKSVIPTNAHGSAAESLCYCDKTSQLWSLAHHTFSEGLLKPVRSNWERKVLATPAQAHMSRLYMVRDFLTA